jgi:cell division initiation protein
MPTSDLDLPLLPSAEQIRRREFATVRRGYDPDQVRDYLEAVAGQLETLEKDLKNFQLTLESRASTTPASPVPSVPDADPYDRISKRFVGLIATADREASRIVDEAKTEADRIRVDAQAKAERAKQEGVEMLESARDESERLLAGLSDRREQLVGQLREMQSKLQSVTEDLEVAIEPSDPAPRDAASDDAVPTDVAEPNGVDVLMDPRYEDLWVANDAAAAGESDDPTIDVPDLASMELDFEDDRPDAAG